jgi:hypothetical protein
MRIGSVSLLVLAAFALAACAGAETGGSTLAASSLNGLDIENCTLDTCPPNPNSNPTPANPVVTPDPNDPDNTNVGNPTVLATGDTTIALENGVIKSPDGGSLSRLTLVANAPPVLDTARIEIDTRTANNGNWPIPKTMNEYEFGTAASGGVGLGGAYKEYRILSATDSGTTVDEELQVWTWGSSYGTQYREEDGSGDARRQAWSFGGTRTPAMPGGGFANYAGRFGATSRTWNWVDNDPLRTVTINNSWRVEGTSNITANFGAGGTITGTLTPTTWNARDTNRVFTDVLSANPADPNWASFMNDDVVLNGVITGNTVSGAASLDPALGWLNGTNPMHAGFFGAGAAEVTGVYNFLAVSPDPIGGEPPANDPGRGFVQQSGVFHGCTPVCP